MSPGFILNEFDVDLPALTARLLVVVVIIIIGCATLCRAAGIEAAVTVEGVVVKRGRSVRVVVGKVGHCAKVVLCQMGNWLYCRLVRYWMERQQPAERAGSTWQNDSREFCRSRAERLLLLFTVTVSTTFGANRLMGSDVAIRNHE